MINMIIVMVIADVTAPMFEEYNGLPGISIPHGFSAAFAPIAWVLNKIIDFIPGVNKIDIDATVLENKMGVFGEPLLVGTIIGLVVGMVAYGFGEYKTYLTLAITMGACLVLIPKMAALLMEGLIPVSDAAQEFIQKKFSKRDKIYIGLDSAVALGHPVTLSVALLLTPITLLLAVIPFMLVFIVPICRGNGFRTFIIGLIIITVGLLISTNLAPLQTQAAMQAAFDMPQGVKLISSLCDGANPLTWSIVRMMEFVGSIFGAIILGVLALGLALWNRSRILKNAKLRKEMESEDVSAV